MSEQIKRLQENDLGFYALPVEDQKFMQGLADKKRKNVVTKWLSKWAKSVAFGDVLDPDYVHRIHRDYNPAPDKPVFEGYELCEVLRDSGGLYVMSTLNCKVQLHEVINQGCCGYVPKEKINGEYHLFTYWPVWINDTNEYTATIITEGKFPTYKPATLGWVAFKKEQE